MLTLQKIQGITNAKGMWLQRYNLMPKRGEIMQKKFTEGIVVLFIILITANIASAIPFSFSLTGTINNGNVWDFNTDNSIPGSVANDISGFDFTMTFTRLSDEIGLWGDGYEFIVDMVMPDYNFDLPGGDFYELHDVLIVRENPSGSLMYDFSGVGISGAGDSALHVTLESNGTGMINAGMGHTQIGALGSYWLQNTEVTWETFPDNNVPVPEPATMALMGLGLAGITARFRTRRAAGRH